MQESPSDTKVARPLARIAAQDLLAIGIVWIATLAVLGKDLSVGGFRDGDAAVHAMDGVLIHDWVAAGPGTWVSPMAFAERQYAHYPALGIGRHYPPGFAVVEAGFFAIFGISNVSSRLCVMFFGLIAAAGTYVFLRSLADRSISALGAVVLVTLPAVTQWGRQTMLELPTLAALVWGAVTFTWYIRRPSGMRLVVLFIVAASAIAFRQTGVFLLGAVALTLVICAARRTVPLGHAMGSIVVAGSAAALVILSLGGNGAQMLRGFKTFPDPWRFDALTFYLVHIPEQVGWLVLPAAGIGLVLWRRGRRRRAEWLLLASWVFVCYVMLTAADCKNARLFFIGLFPFAVWAAMGVSGLLAPLPGTRARIAAAWALGIACCAAAFSAPVAHRPDYGPVVVAHRDKIESRPMLFSGIRDGDFVFALRQHLPWRKAMVLRGSKLLYSCTASPRLDFVSHVASEEDLAELMERFAFAYVFVERANKMRLAEEAMLRSYLAGAGRYRCVASHPLKAESLPGFRDVTIDVYEAVGPRHRTVDHFDIPIPRVGRTIRADLEGWTDS